MTTPNFSQYSIEKIQFLIDEYNKTNEINVNMLNEMKEQFQEMFVLGAIQGMSEYAWWKDGTQYVGSSGRKLSDALKELLEEFPISENKKDE